MTIPFLKKTTNLPPPHFFHAKRVFKCLKNFAMQLLLRTVYSHLNNQTEMPDTANRGYTGLELGTYKCFLLLGAPETFLGLFFYLFGYLGILYGN